MERIIYRKTLDLFKGGRQFVLQGVQTADNIAREVEISLASGGDTYDLPFSNVTACAYITDAKGNVSLVDCTIRNNKVAFCVPKITEAGVAEVTIKIIGTSLTGATQILATPKFSIEVWDSGLNDEDTENTPTFSKLENALARAEEVYDTRLLQIGVDKELVFTADYANDITYVSTAIRDGIGSTLLVPKGKYDASTRYDTFNIVEYEDRVYLALMTSVGKTPTDNADYWADIFNLNSAIANAYIQLNNETIAELVANNSTSYADDLRTTSWKPILVMWDDKTGNTPYTEELTVMTSGYAIISGDINNNHTITAWTEGAEASGVFVAQTTGGEWGGYKAVITEKTLESGLAFGDKGDIVADDNGTYISAKSSDTANYLKVANPDDMLEDKSDAVTATIGGKEYSLYGEHNKQLIEAFGFAKMASGSYTGNGKATGYTIPREIKIEDLSFEPKVLYIQAANNITSSGNYGRCHFTPCIISSGNAYCDYEYNGVNYAFRRIRIIVSWNKEEKTFSLKATSSGVEAPLLMDAENETYHWVVLG